MIRVTVYAGLGENDEPYKPWTYSRTVSEHDLSEHLRRFGLEYKQADYFPTRQTVIVLDPVSDEPEVNVRGLVREASELLEKTGLL